MENQALQSEWSLLQNQYDSYEKYSLLIKLVAFVLVAFSLFSEQISGLFSAVVAALWLQDGIWKTFQGRIELRLIKLEQAIATAQLIPACQLSQDFLANRGSTMNLLTEYLLQALRPTVAFPHAILLVISLLPILCA